MFRDVFDTAVFLFSISMSIFASADQKLPIHKIKLPPGFKISLYATVPGARQMALGEKGVVFVGTMGEGKVYALVPNNTMTKVKTTHLVAQHLNYPNGVTFRKGDLYVAEVSKIIRYPNIMHHLTNPPKPKTVIDTLPSKKWHGYRYIKFGPDDWLYVSIGMPCNICNYRNSQPIFGTIVRIKPGNKALEIYAKGIRNSMGFAWQPKTNALWFSDNGQDWIGNNLPPDEINYAPQLGMDFGFPYFYGDNIRTPQYKNATISKKGMTPPVWELPAHVAPLGVTFYTGTRFPKIYQNQLFVAEHGSWNRTKKIGYQVVMITMNGNKAIKATPFATGWLQGQVAWGRPVDLLVMPDGALLVSDDHAGVIYRITYK